MAQYSDISLCENMADLTVCRGSSMAATARAVHSQVHSRGVTSKGPMAQRRGSISSTSSTSQSDEYDSIGYAVQVDSPSGSDDDDTSAGSESSEDESEEEQKTGKTLIFHPDLLRRLPDEDDLAEIRSSPLFTQPVWDYTNALSANTSRPVFSQYALLGASSEESDNGAAGNGGLFYNITAPSSVFICGNQGSGKSHSLSCFLENCLVPSSQLGELPRPLTGIVFHYDTFISDLNGTPCEAAYLSSHPTVKVRVLCAPTNSWTMRRIYSRLPNVIVEELQLKDSDLNTKRMLDLMAVGAGQMPLYMHIIQRILRDMRVEQQATGESFNYSNFKNRIEEERLTPLQTVPLQQRLETLESFMTKQRSTKPKIGRVKCTGTDWTPVEGQLTIVDLSCPCVTAEMACSLFNICLSLFLEQQNPSIGRVAALDEAHKYMGDSADSQTLTNSLLSAIRLQRHLALRVIISTQEPTVSPKLLDLCNITIVHRFQSPDWLQVLKSHLAGLSTASQVMIKDAQSQRENEDGLGSANTFDGITGISLTPQNPTLEIMSHIVKLRTGEALVFAPSAFVGVRRTAVVEETNGRKIKKTTFSPKRLNNEVMRVRIRARITADGGMSIMAA